MKDIFKRVVAYIIDIVLVSVVITVLTSNSYINKDYDKYTDVYQEYKNFSDNYNEFLTEIEEIYNEEVVTQESIDLLLKNHSDYEKYIKKINVSQSLSEGDYEKITTDIKKYYEDRLIDYSYKLSKLSIIQTIISVLCILMYFVVIEYYLNGKTLGKKLLKLQVVSNNGKKLTILNYLIRSLILNEVIISLMNIIFILVLSKNNYITYNQIIYFVTYTLEMAILFMVMFNKDNRGLHDYASNTKVISLNG